MKFYKKNCGMLIQLAIGFLLFFSSQSLSFSSPKLQFPELRAHDLNGRRHLLPNDLSSPRTLLFIAFEREQQTSINSWLHALKLNAEEQQISWLEVPVLKHPWRLVSFWIDHGMRLGITHENRRAHVWTVYTNRELFLKKLDLQGTQSVVLLVVNREGVILAKVLGDYDKAKYQVISKALQN